MAKTYAWHSGADGLAAEWLLPVPLLADELFSSWLVRAGLMQGCSLYTMITSVWPDMMFRDVDRGMSHQQLAALAKVSGIAPEAFEASMVSTLAQRIDGKDCRRQSIWSWILPLGLQASSRPSGIQYCCHCWKQDEIPFVRFEWRFAWHTACSKHRVALIDRCYQCSAPIRLQYLEPSDHCLSTCAVCKTDLKLAISQKADEDALRFQNTADSVLLYGQGSVWGYRFQSSDWFQIAALLGSYLRRESRRNILRLLSNLQKLDILTHASQFDFNASRIELLGVSERIRLLAVTQRVLCLSSTQIADLKSDKQFRRQQIVSRPHRLSPALKELWEAYAKRSAQPNRAPPFAPRSKRRVSVMMVNLMARLEV